jgi:hypothetical protein
MELAAELNSRQRPVARTLYALAARRFTGTLRAKQGAHTLAVGWQGGRIGSA